MDDWIKKKKSREREREKLRMNLQKKDMNKVNLLKLLLEIIILFFLISYKDEEIESVY